VNADVERDVWKRVFGGDHLGIVTDKSECSGVGEYGLLVSELPLTPPSQQDLLNELVFEDFGFASCCVRPAASLSAFAIGVEHRQACSVVVDCGYSATHVVPYCNGLAQKHAVRRVNVGGKLLTNLLKETVSYRQWNMMDETVLMDDVKRRCCYLSRDFPREMAAARSGGRGSSGVAPWLAREFVLPDFHTTFQGHVMEVVEGIGDGLPFEEGEDPAEWEYCATTTTTTTAAQQVLPNNNSNSMGSGAEEEEGGGGNDTGGEGGGDTCGDTNDREDMNDREDNHEVKMPSKQQEDEGGDGGQQTLQMGVERICIPEVLLRPSDIGMKQMGVAEAIHDAISACDPALHGLLYPNVHITGGGSQFRNLRRRVEQELRMLAPDEYNVCVRLVDGPESHAWRGAMQLAESPHYARLAVTREDYLERGHVKRVDDAW
jgi:actin-related protein 6